MAAIEGGGKVSQAMTEMYDLEFAIKKLWPDKTQDERVSLVQQYLTSTDHRRERVDAIIEQYRLGRLDAANGSNRGPNPDEDLEAAYMRGYHSLTEDELV